MRKPLLIPTPSANLRSWQKEDAEMLALNADNPKIAAFMRDSFPYPYTKDDAERFIAMAIEKSSDNSSAILLAIEVEGKACGGIGVHLLDDVYNGTAEIGYWLAEPFMGRGIVTDAVKTLIPVVFLKMDIVRLQAGVFENNPASMRVLEKCGFLREAVHKNAITKNGKIMDEVIYVRFREK